MSRLEFCQVTKFEAVERHFRSFRPEMKETLHSISLFLPLLYLASNSKISIENIAMDYRLRKGKHKSTGLKRNKKAKLHPLPVGGERFEKARGRGDVWVEPPTVVWYAFLNTGVWGSTRTQTSLGGGRIACCSVQRCTQLRHAASRLDRHL